MFQKNTPGEARVGARDGYNRMVSPHVRLFPHNISENPSYSLPSTIRCTIAASLTDLVWPELVIREALWYEQQHEFGHCPYRLDLPSPLVSLDTSEDFFSPG